jgi:hypothetical protein
MATKRFTDVEKWKDPFFEELTPEYKLIYLYLLDDCDNAGIWNKSMKRLNYSCGTNITEEELMKTFSDRLIRVNSDVCIISKFMYFQYGKDWLTSNNKAVISARNKLTLIDSLSIPYQYPNDTLSIPYSYPIDRAKDKDKDKVKDMVKDKFKDKDKFQDKDKIKFKELEIDKDIKIVSISEDFKTIWED